MPIKYNLEDGIVAGWLATWLPGGLCGGVFVIVFVTCCPYGPNLDLGGVGGDPKPNFFTTRKKCDFCAGLNRTVTYKI